MKATQNSTLSDEDVSEDFEKFGAFTAGVERHATSSVSRGSDNSEDIASYNSSLTPKNETESDLESKYDLALDDLIKAKKCSIMMLKRLKESEEKLL